MLVACGEADFRGQRIKWLFAAGFLIVNLNLLPTAGFMTGGRLIVLYPYPKIRLL